MLPSAAASPPPPSQPSSPDAEVRVHRKPPSNRCACLRPRYVMIVNPETLNSHRPPLVYCTSRAMLEMCFCETMVTSGLG